MASSPQFNEFLTDLFAQMPGVSFRRMFGGTGIFRQGLMFALCTGDGQVALKADGETIPDFADEGMAQWNPPTERKPQPTSGYWYLPDHLFEDENAFLHWSEKAYAVAMRADAKKSPKQRKFKPL